MRVERLRPLGKALYVRAPARVQEALLSGYFRIKSKRLYGATFDRHHALLRRSQWLDAGAIDRLQAERLQHILTIASRTPYYRGLFLSSGIEPREINGAKDLEQVPALPKEHFRRAPEQFVDPRVRDPFVTLTSGTTGTPLRLFWNPDLEPIDAAFLERQYGWVGYRSSDRHVKIRADMVVPGTEQSRSPWRFIRSLNELRMSAFHLSMDTASAYVDRIRSFRPKALIAYPSSAALLAAYVKAEGVDCQIPLVFTSCERLLASQREMIEEALHARVLDHYGQSEGVAAIQQCEAQSYHLIPEYGIIELLPVAGHANTDLREIVATGLWNEAMPLLRYRTGDYVRLGPEEHCSCGRVFPTVGEILGREGDLLLSRNGSWVGRADCAFLGVVGLIEGQILQHEDRSVTVRIVPGERLNSGAEAAITEALRGRLGDLPVTIERVSEIPRDRSGKFRAVVSNSNLQAIPFD